MRKILIFVILLPWFGFTLLAPPQTITQIETPTPVLTSTVQPATTPTAKPSPSDLEKSDWLIILPALLTFLAAVIGSCSWPITILVLLIILRKPMLDRLNDLRLFRFKDFEFEFGKRVQELEKEADQ